MKDIKSIFDEINLNINPYEILGIESNSNNVTIREAYFLLKKSSIPPKERELVEIAYKMLKSDILRSKYNLIKNRPLGSLDEIKNLGLKPQILETNQWINYLL